MLDETRAAATGMCVLAVTGVESERELGYAALHRMIGPFLDRRGTLPTPRRDALGVAIGLVSGLPANRFTVCLAVLTLLAEVATEEPLLCVCDDAQWIDQESLQVLAFLARRLEADPIAILFGVRDLTDDVGPATDLAPQLVDLPMLRLRGLSSRAARTLALESAHGRFDELELGRVLAETGGNPLAIRELAVDWAHVRGRSGTDVPLAERLPLGTVMESRFRERVDALPEQVHTLLLVVAAEPTGDSGLVWRALTALGATGGARDLAEAAEPARAGGLLSVEPTLSFRHPLIRSAVYGGADDEARRRAHAALAAAIPAGSDIDRRAWHLAGATSGPDERVAAELENAAHRAQERAGYSAEAAFLAAAADRTTDGELRATRLLGAGVAATRAGLPERALELLEQVPRDAGALVRGTMALARGDALVQLDRFDEGLTVMFIAARELSTVLPPPSAREALLQSLQRIVNAPWVDVSALAWMLDAPAARAVDLPASPNAVDVLLEAHRAHVLDTRGRGVAAMLRVVALLGAEPSRDVMDRWGSLLVTGPRELLDDEAMVDHTERALVLAREDAAATGLRNTLVAQAITDTFRGRLASAELLHAEAAQVAAVDGGTPFLRRPHDALLRAWQGDAQALARAVDELPPAPAEPRIGGSQTQLVRTAQALFALSHGRYVVAVDAGRRVYDDDPPYWGHFALPDLVEAGVRGGDRAAAEAALRRFEERAAASGTPWALGLLARSRALLAQGPAAEGLHREALERLAATRIVTDQARAHLLYGEWLRRRRRRTDARRELGRAHDLFTAMGATGFAERARSELAAAGARVRRGRGPTETLTAHEARIARLAAAGATNQQIATELVISPNTVEYHLRKVFSKTGVRSRRELGSIALDE